MSSSTVPGDSASIPGLSTNDTLGSAILSALNNVLATQGAALSTATTSVVGGVSQLKLPTPGEGVSTVVGMVSLPGVLNLGDQPSVSNMALVIRAGSPVPDGSAAVTVLGTGQQNMTVTSAQYTNLDYYTGGGSGTINSAGGNNLFGTAASGNANEAWNFAAASGTNTVVAAEGNNTISMGNGSNLVGISGGTDQVTSTGDDTVFVTAGAATINVAPGGSDIVAASNSGSLHFVSESANASTVFGTNTSGNFISGGSVSGGGGVFVGGTGGNNTLVSGQGNTTLIGGGNGDLLSITGAGSNVVIAGAGNETLNASTANGQVSIYTNQGVQSGNNEVITGSNGNDMFWASGNVNATITGNGGQDAYDVVKSHAPQNITITDWTSNDSITTYGYGTTNFVSVTGGFQATLSDGSTITLKTNVASVTNVHNN